MSTSNKKKMPCQPVSCRWPL